jgi:hypothetical protein
MLGEGLPNVKLITWFGVSYVLIQNFLAMVRGN